MAAGHSVQKCACKHMRMTARAVTQFYDRHFQPAGLPAAQFGLLADISAHPQISIGELAELALMDQTTVTRNVETLRKKGYVQVRPDEADSRKKSVSISPNGQAKLEQAMPLWEEAQAAIEREIGAERLKEFLEVLGRLQRIV
ncbi:MAG: MarR family transcriptional regulator [Paenibacillaceae bacterium]|nr:MarR family transcriptional regulator [Paenibacillaceae bacterium]